jgi:Flp pilus assembly protein TadB
MIGHYARDGKLATQRAGRRVWYSIADVEALAGSLQSDLRIAPYTRQDVTEEAFRSIRNISEGQERIEQALTRRDKRQEDIYSDLSSRLERMEANQRPRGPTWQQVIFWGIVILAIVAVAYGFLFLR